MDDAGRHLCLLGDANSVHLRRWAQEMGARGWRVSVLTARPQPIPGVEQRVLPPVSRSGDWLWRVGAARRAVAALEPDLVHAHYVTSYGWLGARCGRRPLVITAWGSDVLVTPRRSALLRALTGWTLRQADLVTGDSLDLVAEIDAYRPRRPAVQIHWGADLSRFVPSVWGERAPFDIVSLRSWESNYRIDRIVAALALLRPGLQAVLHLLGRPTGGRTACASGRAPPAGRGALPRPRGRRRDGGRAAALQGLGVGARERCHLGLGSGKHGLRRAGGGVRPAGQPPMADGRAPPARQRRRPGRHRAGAAPAGAGRGAGAARGRGAAAAHAGRRQPRCADGPHGRAVPRAAGPGGGRP